MWRWGLLCWWSAAAVRGKGRRFRAGGRNASADPIFDALGDDVEALVSDRYDDIFCDRKVGPGPRRARCALHVGKRPLITKLLTTVADVEAYADGGVDVRPRRVLRRYPSRVAPGSRMSW